MNTLNILTAILSITSLSSMCFYGYLIMGKPHSLLIQIQSGSNIKITQKFFLLLASFGLLTCIWSGSKALLDWIPYDIGQYSEYSDKWIPASKGLAGIFTVAIGIPLLMLISEHSYKNTKLREYSLEVDGLTKILSKIDSIKALSYLREEYLEKIKALETEIEAERQPMSIHPSANEIPNKRLTGIYRGLIFEIDNRLKALERPNQDSQEL